ncbi:hypothetical protein AK830_g8256, partial [Neonectria ditissima]
SATSRAWLYAYALLGTTALILLVLWRVSKVRRYRFAQAKRRRFVVVGSDRGTQGRFLHIPAPAVEASWRHGRGRREDVEMGRMNNAAAALRSWEAGGMSEPLPSYEAATWYHR